MYGLLVYHRYVVRTIIIFFETEIFVLFKFTRNSATNYISTENTINVRLLKQ